MPGETVLVIDDSPTIRKVVSTNLRRAGYDVETAIDGQDGIDVAKRVIPRLILLDFVMPRMNGFQFCMALRDIEVLSTIPIILMSAKGDKIGERFVQKMGAVDSITKPFSPEALLAVSDHVLAKYREGTAVTGVPGSPLGIEEGTLADFEPKPQEDATSPRWDPRSRKETNRSRKVAHELASQVANVLAEEISDLGPWREEILRVLAKKLTPTELESISFSIASIEPSAQSAALTGDLAEIPLAEVFQLLTLQRQTGCFEIRQEQFRVLVYFRDGVIDLAQAREGREEFLLGRYMVEDSIIDIRDLEMIIETRVPARGLLGQNLVERGYLGDDELKQILERQTCELIYEVLRWRQGRYAFRPGISTEEADLAQLGLQTENILLEGYRRVDEWRLIEDKIEDFDVVFTRDELNLRRFDPNTLTQEEQKMMRAVDGVRSVREIVDETKMSSFLVCTLLYRLLSVKLIRPRD